MNADAQTDILKSRISFFSPNQQQVTRSLCLYSAAITTADEPCMAAAIRLASSEGVSREMLYEVVLQSYLFLGFPRMLISAEVLDRVLPSAETEPMTRPISTKESQDWFDRGVALCRQVYDSNYEALRDKVEGIAPEIFRWMIVEGYGKVLSRPGLDSVNRELSISSFLMMENRAQQLFSHMRGALNVGTSPELLTQVVEDVGEAAAAGYRTARDILTKLGID